MKTFMSIAALFVSVAITINSFAVTKRDAGDKENPQFNLTTSISVNVEKNFDKTELGYLLKTLEDSDPFVRVEAVQALGETQATQCLVPVSKRLEDKNIYVRAYAAEALGKLGRIDICPTVRRLVSSLDDPSPYVRAMVVSALGELRHGPAAAPLRQLLRDNDETVRKTAEWALNNIENSQGTSSLSPSEECDCPDRF